jgi:DNA-binding response OmpR family regulator
LRILLVENHEDSLTYLTRYLEQQGHEVCGMRDMASALKVIPSSHFDVLISDIGLPDGDGWQLIGQMNPKPFGIAMSGFGASSDREKSHAAGYKHHLTKPFLPDDLDALLEEAASQMTENSGFP